VSLFRSASDNSEDTSRPDMGGMSHGGAGLSVRDQSGGGQRFVVSGNLTVRHLHELEVPLRNAAGNASGPVLLDLGGLESLDTNGALLLNQAIEILRGKGLACSLRTGNELHRRLLQAIQAEKAEEAEPEGHAAFLVFCNTIGARLLDKLETLGQLVGFFGKFLTTVWGIVKRPGTMRWTSLCFHMEQVGVRAVPIVALLTFLIGMVVAYMGAEQMQRFGAQIFAVKLLEVTVLREMAVLITAIVVAGRSSSSFTAQIGAMVANEEVDAMRSMGLAPEVLLVAPRVLALILCLPMLVIIADVAALVGGATAIWYSMGMDYQSFIIEFRKVADINNAIVGLAKTPFFAIAIGLVGCFQGFRATSSAESVGFLTTISVVQAIFIVILLNALFAVFFTTIGF
jgi:ABC-type transport system involved in resistance to organic solvents, permease component